jgi:threonylcarbamoyladenosine tRNA methylthiotransferase CDKAL1
MADPVDIEDISHSLSGHGSQLRAPVVVRRVIAKGDAAAAAEVGAIVKGNAAAAADGDVVSTVPGTQAIWVKTFGCAHNVSDTEYMMGQLQEYGYR